jgi:hypothetical protein
VEKHLSVKETDSNSIQQMKVIGRKAQADKWGKRLQAVHYAAVLLDPRAKNSPILSTVQCQDGESFIKEILVKLNASSEIPAQSPVPVMDDDEMDFYAGVDLSSENEFDRYMREPSENVRTPKELMHYWKIKSEALPHLANVARLVLSIPASSATSERSFSDAGFIINVRRTTLNPENVDKMLFIRSAMGLPVFADQDEEFICEDDS